MIFVTVGNHPQGFNRLLKKVDELARNKVINDVFVQVGHSDYQLEFCRYKKFVGFYKFQDLIKQSDVVITHAGAGTILNALSHGKLAIVVPRLKKHGEHSNDHQLQLTEALETQGKIIAVRDAEKLEEAINKARNLKPKIEQIESNIIELIEDCLAEFNLIPQKQ